MMTKAELHDMRLRAVRGISLTDDEQLALVDACARLVDVVCRWADPDGTVSPHHFTTIGREAVVITREVRFT
jgi:hypothetical protein